MPGQKRYYHPSDTIIDILVGASDGITVPFIAVSGLYGAGLFSRSIAFIGIIVAVAGGVVMFCSALLAGWQQLKKDKLAIRERKIISGIGLSTDISDKLATETDEDGRNFESYAQEYGLTAYEKPERVVLMSSLTIGAFYIIGGLVPVLPFILADEHAMVWCAAVTVTSVFTLSYARATFTGRKGFPAALSSTFIAVAAAFGVFYIARMVF